jgi:hypothetical protein
VSSARFVPPGDERAVEHRERATAFQEKPRPFGPANRSRYKQTGPQCRYPQNALPAPTSWLARAGQASKESLVPGVAAIQSEAISSSFSITRSPAGRLTSIDVRFRGSAATISHLIWSENCKQPPSRRLILRQARLGLTVLITIHHILRVLVSRLPISVRYCRHKNAIVCVGPRFGALLLWESRHRYSQCGNSGKHCDQAYSDHRIYSGW